MDPNRLNAEGARMLWRYLAYAESGGADLGHVALDKPDLNPFERDVRDQLVKAGIPLVPQFGSSGYWIDYAAEHPTEPGRMVLAIECDGASYHSSATARDRDRLRQEHLERLGWRFHRIWSTEWFRHREAEVSKARAAYDAAVIASTRPPTGPVVVAVPQVAEIASNSQQRSARPPVPRYLPIAEYSQQQLVAIARWIESDTHLRTEDQLLEEMMKELGFERRGSRITAALTAAIRVARSK
jgi:very-short-patch-repair endonuclease